MLSDGNVVATLAVKDIEKGKAFYGGTLGLNQTDENPGGVTYTVGSGRLFVYPAPTAGTSQATTAYFEVPDLEKTVEDLKSKGIEFEHYDMPGGSRDGDIHTIGDMKGAWFKDPDGNILGVGSV